jgi:mRNA interferase RelE/StbE
MRLVLKGGTIMVVEEVAKPTSTVEAEEGPAPTFLRRTVDAIKRNAALSRKLVFVSEARRDFSAICNRVAFGKERVVIGRHGKSRVAVIPYEDLQLLEELEDRLDLRAALAALKEAEEEGTAYTVRVAPAAYRRLKKLAPAEQQRVKPLIDGFADDPRPAGCKKLSGHESLYRIRIGDLRVVYQVEDDQVLVLIVAHRREVHRDLERLFSR